MGILDDYLQGRAEAADPHFAARMAEDRKRTYQLIQAAELSKVLSKTIGMSPEDTVQMLPSQQQPERQPTTAQQPEQYIPNPQIEKVGWTQHILEAARQSGRSPQEIEQLVMAESGGKENAQSPTGPQGPTQLSSAAAIDMGINPNQRMDPSINIPAGARYLNKMRAQFGPELEHQAYYDGPGAINKNGPSQAANNYAAKFKTYPLQQQQSYIGASPDIIDNSARSASKFLPNPLKGGEGILGQDMDPTRRAYITMIKQMADSGDPEATSWAMGQLGKMQESSMHDIERTAIQKDLAYTDLQPGSPAYSKIVTQSLLKPTNQTTINTQNGYRPMPLSAEEQNYYVGRKIPAGQPQPYWDKNAEIKFAPPAGMSEDQSKSSQYAAGLSNAITNLNKLVEGKDLNPSTNSKNFIGNALDESGIPGLKSYGVAMQDDAQQQFDQAVKEAKVHIIHALTGGGYSATEAEEKAAAYLPRWGERAPAIYTKQGALLTELESLVNRSGTAATQELRDTVKALRVQQNAREKPKDGPTNKQELPSIPKEIKDLLPPGHTWAE